MKGRQLIFLSDNSETRFNEGTWANGSLVQGCSTWYKSVRRFDATTLYRCNDVQDNGLDRFVNLMESVQSKQCYMEHKWRKVRGRERQKGG